MSRVRLISLYLGILLCLSCCVLLPCLPTIRDGEGYVRSQVSLKSIGMAIRSYHDVNGRLPPAIVHDKDGEPLYSWRVLLLPYLEGISVNEEFHRNEAWDSPNNKPLADKTPRCYVPAMGGSDPPGLTRFQVLIGPGTAFERDGLTWNDFPDGLASTILVVEASEPVPWSKPIDLEYHRDKLLPALVGPFTKPVKVLCYEIGRRPGFSAVFADGSTRFIESRTDEKLVRSMITRNQGVVQR